MNEDLVTTITTARFTRMFRDGYEMQVVDEFLDRLVVRLSAGLPVKEMIEEARFPVASWHETYERREVDLLMSQVKHRALVADPVPDENEVAVEPTVAEAPRIPQPRGESDAEKKGLLSKLFSSR